MKKGTIICNGCGKEGASSMGLDRKKAHEMRNQLRDVGWKNCMTHGEVGPNDYCPKCWDAKRSKHR